MQYHLCCIHLGSASLAYAAADWVGWCALIFVQYHLHSIHLCSAALTNAIVPAAAAAFGWAGVLH
jgi:hypothetical protein